MGYTHYINRVHTLPALQWDGFMGDVQAIILEAHAHGVLVQEWTRDGMEFTHLPVRIRDGMGEGEALITPSLVLLNGDGEMPEAEALDVYGESDLTHETLAIERVYEPQSWQRVPDDGLWFSFCKTERKPYDSVVCAVLLALKAHFPSEVYLSSDGDYAEWEGGRELYSRTFPGRPFPSGMPDEPGPEEAEGTSTNQEYQYESYSPHDWV